VGRTVSPISAFPEQRKAPPVTLVPAAPSHPTPAPAPVTSAETLAILPPKELPAVNATATAVASTPAPTKKPELNRLRVDPVNPYH
jgi:hypothetical protein